MENRVRQRLETIREAVDRIRRSGLDVGETFTSGLEHFCSELERSLGSARGRTHRPHAW